MDDDENEKIKEIPNIIWLELNRKGKSIDQIQKEQNRKFPGDLNQEEFRTRPIWHNKTDLDLFVAGKLNLKPDKWGTDKAKNYFYKKVANEISKLREEGKIIDWKKSTRIRPGIWRPTHTSTPFNVFLCSIEYDKRDLFKKKFVNGVKKNFENIRSISKLKNFQKIHPWGFSSSEKNKKLWQKIKPDDWMIFYYNGKYSYAAKVITKEKSKNLSSKLFKSKSYNKPFLLFFKNILEINKGFQKNQFGIRFISCYS